MKLIWIIGMAALLAVGGCSDDDDYSYDKIPEDLVGVWVSIDQEEGGETRVVIERVSEELGELEWYWNIEVEDSEEHASLMAAKGSFVVMGSKLTLSISHWGTQFLEFDDEQLQDDIFWFTIDDDEWEWFDMLGELSIEFELKNGQLIIKEDQNDDGDYDDEDEVVVFDKEIL